MVLKTRRPNCRDVLRVCMYCRDAHFCKQQEQMCGQQQSSYTPHQTLQQQGGTGEDSYIHLPDWTLSVAAIEKKKKKGDGVSI